MPQQKSVDLLEMFNTFQRDVLENKPSFAQMFNEIRMMNFKIRPLYGDLSELDFQNMQFVETLWSLGKLDEFYQDNVDLISKKQETMFYRLFNEMYEIYHDELNAVNIKSEDYNARGYRGFEMEIFRETAEKQLN